MSDRIEQIRREIEETTSDYDREKLQERLAKLAGGIAVVRVGASFRIRDEIEEGSAGRCDHADRVNICKMKTGAKRNDKILMRRGRVSSRPIIELDRAPICEQSGEQHRNSDALVLIASTDPQFTTDPFDKGPHDLHSQPLAGDWIKSFLQNRTIIGD